MTRRYLFWGVVIVTIALLSLDGWFIFRRDRLLHPEQPPSRPTLALSQSKIEPSCDDRVDAAHLLGLLCLTSALCIWLIAEAFKLYFQE